LLEVYPPGEPTPDRQRHCWVNVVSTRVHLLNPAIPTIASAVQEWDNYSEALQTLIDTHTLPEDFAADWEANLYGQRHAVLFWRSAKDVCDALPGRRK
jgi:hypothetical protein